MDTTQVVIHFIGLVLFSTQVSNDPGLHAILPTITHDFNPSSILNPPTQVAAAPSSSASPSAAPASFATHIEPHVALLVFREDIVVNDSQWYASPIVSRFPEATELASYKYVQLTGEHVTFIVNAPNNLAAGLPANMPRLPTCGTTGELTSSYQWPYSQAAAVVDIPEGTLSVCKKAELAGRIDTRLMLNTTGTLTVVATKSGIVKTLVLNTTNNPTIYLANVPPPRGEGLAPAGVRSGHYLAYYRMIGKETSTCAGPPRPDACAPTMPDCGMTPGFPIIAPATTVAIGRFVQLRCNIRALFQRAGTGGTHQPIRDSMPSVNAECSNTQWP